MCLVCQATKSGEKAAWRGRQVSAENNCDGPRQVSNQDTGFLVMTVSFVAALYLWTTLSLQPDAE